MIKVGVDMVSLERIERLLRLYPDRFIKRIFSAEEIADFNQLRPPTQTVAARFAAKEAVLKAIGCGIGPAALNEVEILKGVKGEPGVRLRGGAACEAAARKISAVSVSMTHEPPFAAAVAVAAVSPDGDINGVFA